MSVLKDPRFWGGVVVGYLICVFVPAVKFGKSRAGGVAG